MFKCEQSIKEWKQKLQKEKIKIADKDEEMGALQAKIDDQKKKIEGLQFKLEKWTNEGSLLEQLSKSLEAVYTTDSKRALMRESLQKYEHERQRSLYEIVFLKQRIDKLEREARRLKRDLIDKQAIPDPKDEERANVLLTESQMKRDDLMDMQKNFDHLAKKVQKYDRMVKKQ